MKIYNVYDISHNTNYVNIIIKIWKYILIITFFPSNSATSTNKTLHTTTYETTSNQFNIYGTFL